LALVALALSASAARADPSSDRWDEQWRQVCAYDISSDGEPMCSRVKDAAGAWKLPSPEGLALVKGMRDELHAAAVRYAVDPRAIAAVLVVERSLNVTRIDRAQDMLARMPFFVGGKLAGVGPPFSIGVGQLYLQAALAVEPLAARIERRARRSEAEVWRSIQQPKRALRYVAAVLRQAQDAYREQGFDLAGRPELLATLYNLGEPDRRAAVTRAAGRAPRVNYFGLFALRALPQIEAALR
jgi:hypothetical protein